MKSALYFHHEFSRELPKELKSADMRLSESFLRSFIETYSSPGDRVFDPFAGLGTALIVAESLDRIGMGVEVDQERYAYARSQIEKTQNLVSADIRTVDINRFPRFALSISSPIYMHQHESLDPLTGFSQAGTYDSYLAELTSIYTKVAHRLEQGGHLLIEAANLKSEHGVTTFAWDLCNSLRAQLKRAKANEWLNSREENGCVNPPPGDEFADCHHNSIGLDVFEQYKDQTRGIVIGMAYREIVETPSPALKQSDNSPIPDSMVNMCLITSPNN